MAYVYQELLWFIVIRLIIPKESLHQCLSCSGENRQLKSTLCPSMQAKKGRLNAKGTVEGTATLNVRRKRYWSQHVVSQLNNGDVCIYHAKGTRRDCTVSYGAGALRTKSS